MKVEEVHTDKMAQTRVPVISINWGVIWYMAKVVFRFGPCVMTTTSDHKELLLMPINKNKHLIRQEKYKK